MSITSIPSLRTLDGIRIWGAIATFLVAVVMMYADGILFDKPHYMVGPLVGTAALGFLNEWVLEDLLQRKPNKYEIDIYKFVGAAGSVVALSGMLFLFYRFFL